MPKAATSRAGWTTAAFGDVVRLSTERSSNPESDGFERFVGLEHIEPGDLCIRRWGDIADGTTFTSVFRPGQVLFGKRRAYQRKVAVADFSGVCSGDIYVLEPKGQDLLPELLPFICQTDAFFEHAVGTSAGSLSPRTNWTSLSRFEFALPPIEEQQRIVSALSAAQCQQEVDQLLLHRQANMRVSLSAALFRQASRNATVRPIGDAVIGSAYGPRFSSDRYATDGNAYSIRTTDFLPGGRLNFDSVPAARLDQAMIDEHRLVDGDFLLSRSGEYAGMVRVFHADAAPNKPFIPAAFLIRLRLRPSQLLPQFLVDYCESPHGRAQLQQISCGSAQPNISGSAFMDLRIPMPDLATQESVALQLNRLRQAELHLEERMRSMALVAGLLLERSLAHGGK